MTIVVVAARIAMLIGIATNGIVALNETDAIAREVPFGSYLRSAGKYVRFPAIWCKCQSNC